MSYREIVDDFNNGNFEVVKYFNDYNTFFNILNKRGYIELIDPKEGQDSEEWENHYLLWLYQNDISKFHQFVVNELSSDLTIDENGKIFLVLDDRSELAVLFCNNYRNGPSRETVEQLLSGQGDFYDAFNNTTSNVYSDVIEQLDSENNEKLQQYIVSNLKDIQIEPETTELELIAESQGHPEYAIIDLENVSDIINDEETMDYLLDNDLYDLKSELYSIHNSAYNNAYESEMYDSLWKEINDYFDGSGEWISRPHKYKKDTTVQGFKLPVSTNFDTIILDYLNDNVNSGNTGLLQYWGSYLGLLADWVECLSVYYKDYADSSEVEKNINLYFSDYI